jgi:hypothetical protein
VYGNDLGRQRLRVLKCPAGVSIQSRDWHDCQMAAHRLKRIRIERSRTSA